MVKIDPRMPENMRFLTQKMLNHPDYYIFREWLSMNRFTFLNKEVIELYKNEKGLDSYINIIEEENEFIGIDTDTENGRERKN